MPQERYQRISKHAFNQDKTAQLFPLKMQANANQIRTPKQNHFCFHKNDFALSFAFHSNKYFSCSLVL